MALISPILDDRSYAQLRDELVRRISVYTPEWTDHNESDPGIALLELFAYLGESTLFRFNQIPETTKIEFLRLLGVRARTARPATALLAASTDRAAGVPIEAGTEVRAGSVVFSTTGATHVWPVEVTAVGKTFKESWTAAAAQVKKWSGLDQLKLVDVVAAQSEFPPSPPSDLVVVDAKKDLGFEDTKFATLLASDVTLAAKEVEGRMARIASIVKRPNINAATKANEIGIVYARDGQLNDAVTHFREAITADSRMFKAYNNLANVHYLLGQNKEAIQAYEQALSVGGDQAPVLINLASLYYEMGDKTNAKAYFDRAARMEPVYEKEYPELAAVSRGDDSKVAARAGGSGSSKAAGIGAGERDPRRSRWIP